MKKTTNTNENAQETQKTWTRAEKKDATKNLIKGILRSRNMKSNELIDEAAKVFAEHFQGEENENPNDVKGRIGSVLDVMKKEGEVQFDGGRYALKKETAEEKPQEKPVKKATKKAAAKTREKEEAKEEISAEKPAPKKRATKTKAEETGNAEIKTAQPQEKKEEKSAEKPAPKKRGRKPKAEQAAAEPETATTEMKAEETRKAEDVKEQEPATEEKTATPVLPIAEEKKEEVKTENIEKAEAKEEVAEKKEEKISSPQGTLMDMSFLFDALKPQVKPQAKPEEKPQERTEKDAEKTPAQPQAKSEEKAEIKAEEKPQEKVAEKKPQEQKARGQVQVQVQKQPQKTEEKPQKAEGKKPQTQPRNTRAVKTQTADEKLQEAFLNRLHRLGGEYFEYYSIYLLEKYSRMNGRRLEMLKITGGERDGGIDGEIELTDRLGFRETIYIQAKNWDPSKGDEKLWVVGETLLQQFIGACVCRQAKDGKQHCRGIFITTSRFTPEAKKILNDTSDKFVGYDGADLYEAAKECKFGLVQKNGEWALDEQLLSGVKAFYSMV